jgi:hypothetical protein
VSVKIHFLLNTNVDSGAVVLAPDIEVELYNFFLGIALYISTSDVDSAKTCTWIVEYLQFWLL